MNHSAALAAMQILRSAVERRIFPAAVAQVGSSRDVLWSECFGTLSFDDGSPRTAMNTIFDLASLTKPMATTSVAMKLAAEARMPIDMRLGAILREWAGADRDRVTVGHLLEHTSGLSARLMDRPPHGRRPFEHEICVMPLEYAPRTRSIYSDLGFILLGFCSEDRGEAPLAKLTRDVLALIQTGRGEDLLVEVSPDQRERTAPTFPLDEDQRRGRRLIGEVHDNYAAALGGFAGHAGLFGTAAGVGRFARTVLAAARGTSTTDPPFTRDLVWRATTKSGVPGSSRALGWDTMLPTSSCGTQLSEAAFGHVGFTGTSLWIDPVLDRYFVLLTNRVCGGGTSEEMQHVRRSFHDAAAAL
jgi:CubicO group peptidase (beta-lactamase class C family)